MKCLTIQALSTLLVCMVAVSSAMGRDMPLDLGLASPYAILAGSTVTSTGTVGTVVTGDIGVFPGTEVTGFPPAIINGAIDSANGASGGAQGALTTAYNEAAGKPFNTTLSDMDLGGMTLLPGVYKFDEAAAMNGMLTLDADGDAAAVWTFQIGSSLLIAEGSSIIFKDSIGNPDYVYWQVGTSATLAIGVPMIGNIMALASITVNDGATVKGRCLARNAAVTLDNSVITMPTTVAFSVIQTVTGVSIEQFNNHTVLNTAVFKQAIAQTMTGVLPFNVQDFLAAAGPTTNAIAASLRTMVTARALTTSSIVLNYNVIVSSTMTAEELMNQLTTAIENGTFDQYLHEAAIENGATDLMGSSSDTVIAEPILTDDTTNTPNPPGNDDTADSSSDSSKESTLSAGAIAGIVIGGFVGLVLIAMIVYFFAFHNLAGASNQAAAVPSQQV